MGGDNPNTNTSSDPNGPKLDGAKVDDTFSGIEKFMKSLLGFLNKHPDMMVGLAFIADLIATQSWTAASAGAAETKTLIAQGATPVDAFFTGTVTGGVFKEHPILATAGAGVVDTVVGAMDGHKSILQLGKELWHHLFDKKPAAALNTAPAPAAS